MVILAGCAGAGGKLANRGDEPAPTAANVLSFVSLIVGWTLSWAPLASDFFAYHSPAIPSWKIFLSVRRVPADLADPHRRSAGSTSPARLCSSSALR